jgi:hypothetical protein
MFVDSQKSCVRFILSDSCCLRIYRKIEKKAFFYETEVSKITEIVKNSLFFCIAGFPHFFWFESGGSEKTIREFTRASGTQR